MHFSFTKIPRYGRITQEARIHREEIDHLAGKQEGSHLD